MAQLYRAFFDDAPGRSFETDGITVYGTNLMHILRDKPKLDRAAQVLFDKGCHDDNGRPDNVIGRSSSYRRFFLGCFANDLAQLSMDASALSLPVRLCDPESRQSSHGFFRPVSHHSSYSVDSTLAKSVVAMSMWQANKSREDRNFCLFDAKSEALLLGVLDGHGKSLCAEVVNRWMPTILSNALAECQEDKLDAESCAVALSLTFAMCDALWLDSIDHHTRLGESSTDQTMAKFGSGCCALACVVSNSFVCVANAGDCRAILLSRPKDSESRLEPTLLTTLHIASNADEYDLTSTLVQGRDRLPIRPAWSDIASSSTQPVSMKRLVQSLSMYSSPFPSSDKCNDHLFAFTDPLGIDRDRALRMTQRVAGTLMVTRSLGDAYLKDTKYDMTGSYFGAPYIHCLPEVCSIRVDPSSEQVLVIASDGLWDFLTLEHVAQCLSTLPANLSDSGAIDCARNHAEWLVKHCLYFASKDAKMSMYDAMTLEPGQDRRRIYDDITCLIVWIGHSPRAMGMIRGEWTE